MPGSPVPGRGPRPENGAHRSLAGIFLAPGAGGSAESPAFVELASSLEASGVPVQRMDFPYRLAGRRRPDPPAVLEASVRERACSFARHLGTETSTLVLGGRSMGGRICSQVVAEGLPAAGLALVSYPLHPPGRPERLRVAHFPQLRVPCLFVSGTKDAFATRDELETATAAIPGPVSHVWLEGADHGLRKHGAAAAAAILQWLASTFRLPTGGGTSEP
ncbi:MAG: dienelactone hydrolase family protein [Actinomycetota bacterium]|nr:dienelactone hydrolase family protein [Actinomycetota bacterium]